MNAINQATVSPFFIEYDESKLKEIVKTKTDTEIAEMITNGDIDENEISLYLGYKRICSVGKILYG